MSKTVLYQKTRLGKMQQWSIWLEEQGKLGFPEVWIEHGLTDGKKQTTFDLVDKGVNEGKANETSPLQQAKLVMERKITKQKEHGYVEDIDQALEEKGIDFNEPMLKELCFYKPKNSIEDDKVSSLEKDNRAVYTVKRDGMMHVIRSSKKFGVEIYTRTMDNASDKYPHLLSDLKSKIPEGTVLLGELILEQNGKDNFNAVSSICRSDAEEAIKKQSELGKLSYYIFDIAYHNHDNLLTSKGYKHRLDLITNMVKEINSPYVRAVEIISKLHAKALEETRDRGLEGLVVWDSEGLMKPGGDFTFNGKAYRPNVIWKSKLKYEDDFIVRWDPKNKIGDYGKGKNKNRVGQVFLYQLDDNGNEIYLGKCGGGLTDEQREFYVTANYPRVWRVEYDSIQPKTGSLRFPVFNADRTLNLDKEIKECLLSEKIKEAKETGDEDE